MARRGGPRAAPALLAAAALLFLATTPARASAAEATCVWSSCTSNPLKGCGQLNTPTVSYEKKEAKGCACQRVNRWLCLPGRTQLCCPVAKDPAECDWYDVDCNWENLKEDVDEVLDDLGDKLEGKTEELKLKIQNLRKDVREKILDAKEFANLAIQDLKDVPDDLLASLRTVQYITKEQLEGIADKVHDMAESVEEKFLEHVHPETLAQALETFGKKVWNDKLKPLPERLALHRKAKAIVARVKQSDALSDVAKWPKAQVTKLGGLLVALGEVELPKVNVKFAAALDDKVFIDIDFTIDPAALFAAIRSWGSQVKIGAEKTIDALELGAVKARHLYLEFREVAGPAVLWTRERIEDLGLLIQEVDMDDLREIKDDVLAAAQGAVRKLKSIQIESMGEKIQNMAEDLAEKVIGALDPTELIDAIEEFGKTVGWRIDNARDKVRRIVAKCSEKLGPIKYWTAAQFDKLGEMVAALPWDEIAELTDEVLSEIAAAAKITGAELSKAYNRVAEMAEPHLRKFLDHVLPEALDAAIVAYGKVEMWTAETLVPQVKILIEKIEQSPVWGKIETWSGAALDKLGELVAAIPWEKIEKLADAALAEAVTVAKITARELAHGAERLTRMAAPHFRKFIDHVAEPALDASVEALGKAAAWARETAAPHVLMLLERLAKSPVWGEIARWSGEQLDKLGEMIANLPWGKIAEFADDALADAVHVSKIAARELAKGSRRLVAMATPHLEKFVKHVLPATLDASIEALGQAADWAADTAAPAVLVLLERIKDAKVWGRIGDWSKDKFDTLGEMVANIPWEEIAELGNDVLSEIATAVKIHGKELAKAAGRLAKMSGAHLGKFLSHVARESLELSVEAWASSKAWTKRQLPVVAAALKNAAGDVGSWSKDTVKKAGVFLAGLKDIELPKLSVNASVTIEPRTIDAMDADQVSSLTEAQLDAMSAANPAATAHITGEQLEAMTEGQARRAVCRDGAGGATYQAGGAQVIGSVPRSCPAYVIDVEKEIRGDETAASIANNARTQLGADGVEYVTKSTMAEDVVDDSRRRELSEGGPADVVSVRVFCTTKEIPPPPPLEGGEPTVVPSWSDLFEDNPILKESDIDPSLYIQTRPEDDYGDASPTTTPGEEEEEEEERGDEEEEVNVQGEAPRPGGGRMSPVGPPSGGGGSAKTELAAGEVVAIVLATTLAGAAMGYAIAMSRAQRQMERQAQLASAPGMGLEMGSFARPYPSAPRTSSMQVESSAASHPDATTTTFNPILAR